MSPPGVGCLRAGRCGFHTTNILPAQDHMFVPPDREESPVLGTPGGQPADQSGELLVAATAALAEPGLVVLTGGPGVGRSTALRRLGEAFRGPVFAGGGLAMLRGGPAFALARAVKVRLPGQDQALLAEAVRFPGRHRLVLLHGLPWAHPAATAALPG